MGARREQSCHSNNFLKLPLKNLLIYPAASRSVWYRGAGFFYIQIECLEGEDAVIAINIGKLIITKKNIYISWKIISGNR